MKKTGTHVLRWLSIGIIIMSWQVSAAIVFGIVHESSHEARSHDKLIQGNGSRKDVSCKDALKNASVIKVGMRESEVLDLLGKPTGRLENEWGYNFMACVQPPQAGEQKIIGLGLVFSEGIIKQIKYATVDATGPAPGYAPTRKKEKKRPLKSRKHASANAMADKSLEPSGPNASLSSLFAVNQAAARFRL
jgi:hypothetical protein